jgi:ribonuclease VapC
VSWQRSSKGCDEAALDTSALYAILDDEEEAEALLVALGRYGHLCVSAGTLAELSIVLLRRRSAESITDLERLLAALGIEVVAVDHQAVQRIREGFIAFGKGMGNRAQLNFGDLFAYALCKERGIPLFFRGDDFAHTDLIDARRA